MYLTSFYDMDFQHTKIYLNNFSNKDSEYKITFYDKDGKKAHETKPSNLVSHGTIKIELSSIKEIRQKSGLFIIKCSSGVRGEIFHKDNGGTKSTSVLIEGLPPFSTEGITIFISYAMKSGNSELYDLISSFLKLLGFSILSANESGRSDLPPGMQIRDMIKESDVLLAILTQDITTQSDKGFVYYPSHNVMDEIGQASDKTVIVLAEENVNVASNITTRATYSTFSMFKKEEMLLNLLESLKRLKIF